MKKIFLFIVLLSILSCAQKEEASSSQDSMGNEVADLSKLPSTDLYSDGKNELIKTAELRFQVASLKKSREEIDVFIRKYSAFIASSELKYENPTLEEHLTVRVLSIAFDPLLKEIEQQASYLNYRKVNSDDVSKEFVDLESRLKSKRDMELRYAEIIRKKASTTEDLLKAEYEIGKLHEEIEAVVSRINFLKDQVRYSTIKLEIYQVMEQQKAVNSIEKPLSDQFSGAFKTGWNGLTQVLITLTNLWPLIILGFVTPFLFTLWKKGYFLKRRSS